MKLFYSSTSPFARKVRIAAAEVGLDGDLDLVPVDPWRDPQLRKLNPLSKVPTLVAQDGLALFESALICEYLDALGSKKLIPQAPSERWRALRLRGLADGTMIAMGRLFADERRPADQRSDEMMARFVLAREASLDWLEGASLQDEPTIGEVAVAACLGYLDFRWPERRWRTGRDRLASWFDRFSRRPSMTATGHAL